MATSTRIRPLRSLVAIGAGLALAGGGLAAGSAPAVAVRAPSSSSAATQVISVAHQATWSGSKPTIVLVHGAFADASGWNREIARLEQLGFPVLAPANPLRGLTADADYIRSVLATIPGPVILVGHSYGGAVITNAARGASNVIALVYVAAFIPAAGTSVATSYDPSVYPGSLLAPTALVVRPVPNAVAPGGQDADLTIRPDLFRQVFAGDQSPGRAAVMAAEQRPLSLFAFTEPSGDPAWETLPSWDLLTLDDHAISPSGQQFMAERAHATITRVSSAHDVLVSRPRAVVDVILAAVRATHGA